MLEILRERDVACDVIEYLKTPLDRTTIERLIDILPGKPAELVREDKLFKELGLSDEDVSTKEKVVALLLEQPKLMQRPVVVLGARAVIARPSDKVLEILG